MTVADDGRHEHAEHAPAAAASTATAPAVATTAGRLPAAVLGLQRAAGNRATVRLVRRRLLQREETHLARCIRLIREDIARGTPLLDAENGVFWILNGQSKERMAEIYNGLRPPERKWLEDNLDKTGFDRARMYQAIQQAKAGGTWWRDKSDEVQRAIRRKDFTSYPGGAYWQINPLNDQDRAKIMQFLDRDDLDELILQEDVAVAAGVPNAPDIARKARTARDARAASEHDKRISGLIPGTKPVNLGTMVVDLPPVEADVREAFKELAKLADAELKRVLRALPAEKRFVLKMNIAQVDEVAVGAADRIRHLLQHAELPEDKLMAWNVERAVWRPEYKHPPGDYSRIIQIESPANLQQSVDVTVDEVSDAELPRDEVEKQYRDAGVGRGGLKWPKDWNKSTLPNIWKMKQDVKKARDELGYQDVLTVINAYLSVEWILFAGVGFVGGGVNAGAAMRRPRVSGPFGTGGRMPPSARGEILSPDQIRFSQSSVTDAAEIEQSMRASGWKGDAIDVVRMPDGKLTTLDNTRLLAASRAKVNVSAAVHAHDEPLPTPELIERFSTKKGAPATWGDAVKLRIGKQSAGYRNRSPMGSYSTGSAE